MRCDTSRVDGDNRPRRFLLTDKHGLTRHAYNLEVAMEVADTRLQLGLLHQQLQEADKPPPAGQSGTRPAAASQGEAATAEELFDDLALLLKKRNTRGIVED